MADSLQHSSTGTYGPPNNGSGSYNTENSGPQVEIYFKQQSDQLAQAPERSFTKNPNENNYQNFQSNEESYDESRSY